MSRIPRDPNELADRRAALEKLSVQILRSLDGADQAMHIKVLMAVTESMLRQGGKTAFYGCAASTTYPDQHLMLLVAMGDKVRQHLVPAIEQTLLRLSEQQVLEDATAPEMPELRDNAGEEGRPQ